MNLTRVLILLLLYVLGSVVLPVLWIGHGFGLFSPLTGYINLSVEVKSYQVSTFKLVHPYYLNTTVFLSLWLDSWLQGSIMRSRFPAWLPSSFCIFFL